jgi:large exoprotein involved in heme utilization and adhesion
LTPIDKGWALGYEGVPSFSDIKLDGVAYVDASGNGGGEIQVQGRQVSLYGGSQIVNYTLGDAQGGNLTVNASDLLEVSGYFASDDYIVLSNLGSGSFGDGSAGDLTINTQQLIVRDGAFLSTSTYGSGFGGKLNVNASQSVELSGFSAIDTNNLSGLYARTQGAGAGGDVSIVTQRLIVRDGARVDTSTLADGNAGSVKVDATESVTLSGTTANREWPSAIFTQTIGNGAGGDLRITTRQLSVLNDAEISSATSGQQGGNITINAQNIQLRNNSPISSRVMDSTGQGGDITINSNIFIALEGSDVLATAKGGNGGNITINSPVFLADIYGNGGTGVKSGNTQDVNELLGDSRVDISAQSQASVSGDVKIPDFTFLQNALSAESTKFVSAEQAVANSCLARRNVQQSKFTITGTGGLPVTPYDDRVDGWYGLPVAGEARDPRGLGRGDIIPNPQSPMPNPQSAKWKVGNPIVEAQRIVRTADGRTLIASASEKITQSPQALICDRQ